MDIKTLFSEKLPEAFKKDPAKAKELGAVYMFKITGDGGGTWSVDCKADPPSVSEGECTADCTLELTSEDFNAMLKQPELGMQLFFQGKLKVTGDPMLATKLGNLLGIAS